jgi:hypothetical protein
MTTYIHKADIGTIFRLTIVDTDGDAIDVSTASVKYIYFRKPDGTLVKETAAFYTDGSDGIIQYTSVSGDIDTIGDWQVQGYVETTDGKFFTEIAEFTALPTLYTAS